MRAHFRMCGYLRIRANLWMRAHLWMRAPLKARIPRMRVHPRMYAHPPECAHIPECTRMCSIKNPEILIYQSISIWVHWYIDIGKFPDRLTLARNCSDYVSNSLGLEIRLLSLLKIKGTMHLSPVHSLLTNQHIFFLSKRNLVFCCTFNTFWDYRVEMSNIQAAAEWYLAVYLWVSIFAIQV